MRKRIQGLLYITLGLACLAGSLFFSVRNNNEAKQAEADASHMLAKVETHIAQTVAGVDQTAPSEADEEMPVEMVDGIEYIGVINIPAFEISLPVIREISRENLKIAPCLYVGNYKTSSMILAAHNYKAHFGLISKLLVGDRVHFTNVDGQTYEYTVASTEILKGNDVEGMMEGEWDLTLFTCTYGGADRVTVRCVKA